MPSSPVLLLLSVASLAVLLASVLATPMPQAYQFSAGVDEILDAPLVESFNCEGRNYGYYADVDNNCQVFHVCMPVEDDAGDIIETMQWSFVCGNQTRFDQQTLACSHPNDAIPCEESEAFFDVNDAFGQKDSDY